MDSLLIKIEALLNSYSIDDSYEFAILSRNGYKFSKYFQKC